MGEPSFGTIPPDLRHHSAEQNKELLSLSGSKGKTQGGITVMIREAIFLILIHFRW